MCVFVERSLCGLRKDSFVLLIILLSLNLK